jgi:hypothetical protein
MECELPRLAVWDDAVIDGPVRIDPPSQKSPARSVVRTTAARHSRTGSNPFSPSPGR